MQVRRAVWATRQRETSEIFSGRQVHARRCSNGARGGRTKLIPLTSALNKKLLSADPIFDIFHQGLPILTVGTSMAVTITHVFLWGSSATNHIENALMGSPCFSSSKVFFRPACTTQ
jgi:hypothetical protein